MKKLISIILALACAVSLTACSEKKGNPLFENAAWEGYENMSFIDFVEKGLVKVYASGGNDCTVDVTYEEGWSKAEKIDQTDIGEGNVAVTYIINVHSNNTKSLDMKFYFYMEMPGDNLLIARGATAVYSPDDTTPLDAYRADMLLSQIIDYME